MSIHKKEAIESINPFIKYLCNLSVARKMGFVFFIKTSSRNNKHLKTLLGNSQGVYKNLLKNSIHIPIILAQVIIFLFCLLFILSIANSAPYLYYFFSGTLLLIAIASALLIRISSISKSGLALQFRIPENFEGLSSLIESNYQGMTISKSSNVRYAAIAFEDLKSGELNSHKLISVIEGIIEYFDIEDTDARNKTLKEDAIETLIHKSLSKEYSK